MSHHLLVRGRDVDVPDLAHDHNYNQPIRRILSGLKSSNAEQLCGATSRRYLFMRSHESHESRNSATAQSAFQDPNLQLDVDSLSDNESLPHDLSVEEDDGLRELHRAGVPEVTDPVDWTVTIESASWYRMEHLRGLFQRLVEALNRDRLARLASSCVALRQLQVRQLAKELRLALGSVQWERDWCRWVNYFLLTYLPLQLLASYISGMRLVRRRLPGTFSAVFLDDKDLGRNVLRLNVVNVFCTQAIDPAPDLAGAAAVSRFVAVKTQTRANSVRPILLLLVPQSARGSVRLRRLVTLLGALGDVELLNASSDGPEQSVARHFREQWEAVRRCIFMHPTRDVLALGFGPVACLAVILATTTLKTADTAHLVGLVLLGAPSAEAGTHDFLADLRHPTLLVIGANSTHSGLEALETARESWTASSQMVVLGGCDHYLRMQPAWKALYRVSQAQVDVELVQAVADFLINILPSSDGADLEVETTSKSASGVDLRGRVRGEPSSTATTTSTSSDIQLAKRPRAPLAYERSFKKRKQQHGSRTTFSPRAHPSAMESSGASAFLTSQHQQQHQQQHFGGSTLNSFRRDSASTARPPQSLLSARTQLPDAAETQAALAALCDSSDVTSVNRSQPASSTVGQRPFTSNTFNTYPSGDSAKPKLPDFSYPSGNSNHSRQQLQQQHAPYSRKSYR